MSYAARLFVCAALSAAAHALLARGAARLPELVRPARPEVVQVRLVPPPAPPPGPEPAPPVVAEAPAPRTHVAPVRPATSRALKLATPTERPQPVPATATPVFGVAMESTSQAGDGPSVPVGNTLEDPAATPHAARASSGALAPVSPDEVTRMPMPDGRCSGGYTEAARRAGLEGTVVLDLVVAPDGSTHDITVVQGLGGGLTEAAIAAVSACRFRAGERAGTPVAVRVRGFKIHFFLSGGD
jgi:protein TonB